MTITPILPSDKWLFLYKFTRFSIAQLLAVVIFVSVSLIRENLRGLRENLKHKIRTLELSRIPEAQVAFDKAIDAIDRSGQFRVNCRKTHGWLKFDF